MSDDEGDPPSRGKVAVTVKISSSSGSLKKSYCFFSFVDSLGSRP